MLYFHGEKKDVKKLNRNFQLRREEKISLELKRGCNFYKK